MPISMPIFRHDLERRESADGDVAMSSLPHDDDDNGNGNGGNNNDNFNENHSYNHDRADSRLARKLSEESIRTELCDGPIPAPGEPQDEALSPCSDRAELIERLKRGESPTWLPSRHANISWPPQPGTPKSRPDSPSLLPPPAITPEKPRATEPDNERLRQGLTIERPRSALHTGDFTQDESSRNRRPVQESRHDGRVQESPARPQPWLATSPPRHFTPFAAGAARQPGFVYEDTLPGIPSLSSSLSSSFAYKPPTSPLVQSESNDDLGLASPMEGISMNANTTRSSRRHTVMPSQSGFRGSSSLGPTPNQPPFLRQERSYPYQAHQPRRSLQSNPSHSLPTSAPQTPAILRSRRPSYSSDTSPMQHASMVGSYEESILRGRMSTTPSKPLDFVAQIGVLGLGKCKTSLRCPAHVTLPFPAVFYSYGSTSHGRSKDEDGPSPYVGQIDLENGLTDHDHDARSKRKLQSRAIERSTHDDHDRLPETPDRAVPKTQRNKRRPDAPRAPPGGSYRIPEKGQIQIIIKNPNKTAVKLFLVPYDLAGMEPGTKTFIRQRSYSAGPIIPDVPALKDTGAADRPILRYLVHLHICCPSRERYYLYKSIRVVFANRVPDGKEKLRNEITLPEPRFTSYKPIRVMHPPITAGTGPGASLAAEKALRRRSSGFYTSPTQAFGATVGFSSEPPMPPRQRFPTDSMAGPNLPVSPIPFRLPPKQRGDDMGPGRDLVDAPSSPQCSQGSTTSQDSSHGSSGDAPEEHIDMYNKLNKGDAGYGGNAFSGLANGSPGVAEGLLSQRLRTLGVRSRSGQDGRDREFQ